MHTENIKKMKQGAYKVGDILYYDPDPHNTDYCLYKNVIQKCIITRLPTRKDRHYYGYTLGYEEEEEDDVCGWLEHELHTAPKPINNTQRLACGDEVQVRLFERYGISVDGSRELIFDPPDTWVHAVIFRNHGEFYTIIRTKWDVRNLSNSRCYDTVHQNNIRREF